jgi:hypothetical protein
MSDAIAEMERAIGALALELPGEVWTDVRDRWERVRAALDRQQAVVEAALVYVDAVDRFDLVGIGKTHAALAAAALEGKP